MRKQSNSDVDDKKVDPRKSKGKRSRSNKSRSKYKDRRASEELKSATNDPAWYSMSPELLRDAASIPFSWPVGTKLDTGSYMSHDYVPGIAVMRLMPCIGSSTNRYSPANVASSAIYSFVRHANSGHSNYDAPDLMMYLLGISSVYSFITWCQRLLGLVMTYDQRNRYLPEALISANNVSYSDLHSNIANFRFWLNTFISKVSSFAVPNIMPFFSRAAFLYSNYYIDGPSIKDQFYMYAPTSLTWLKFHINEETSLGELIYSEINPSTSGSATVAEIEAYGDALFNAIWEQEDFGIMSGDILKAYGDNIIKLSPVPELLVQQPVYDPMFLHQFKNAKCVGKPRVDFGKIFQNANDGTINQAITLKSGISAGVSETMKQIFESNTVLTSDFDSPTPEVVIESTRLMPAYNRSAIRFETGSEVPIEVQYWYTTNGDLTATVSATMLEDMDSNSKVHALLPMISRHFKYAPEIRFILISNNVPTAGGRFWDIDNYAVLSSSDLTKMHATALMSMLAVPSIAKL